MEMGRGIQQSRNGRDCARGCWLLWRVRRMRRRREWKKELGFQPSGPEKFSKGQKVAGGPGLERAFLLRISSW